MQLQVLIFSMKKIGKIMAHKMIVEGKVSTLDATAGEGISEKMTIELILIKKKKPAV